RPRNSRLSGASSASRRISSSTVGTRGGSSARRGSRDSRAAPEPSRNWRRDGDMGLGSLAKGGRAGSNWLALHRTSGIILMFPQTAHPNEEDRVMTKVLRTAGLGTLGLALALGLPCPVPGPAGAGEEPKGAPPAGKDPA